MMGTSTATDQEVIVGKQERKAKVERKADDRFAAILEAAVKKVRASSELRPDQPEIDEWVEASKDVDNDTLALAISVRHLRDHQGMAWWMIGQQLGLPGAGTSAATGKGGAAYARKLYAKAFGAAPRTQKERKPSTTWNRETNEDRIALKAQPKAERVQMVRAGKPVIREEATDEEIVEMIKGRHIAWTLNLNNIDGRGDEFYEHEADVHRSSVGVGRGKDGQRYVSFFEVDRSGPLKLREMSGPARCIRVSAIHSVR